MEFKDKLKGKVALVAGATRVQNCRRLPHPGLPAL
jgi:hypothetical protein